MEDSSIFDYDAILDATGFKKDVESDVSAFEAADFLKTLQAEKDSHWGMFSDQDIEFLARIFSFLKFKDDEDMMKKGEAASFFGVIVQGKATIRVTDDLTFKLGVGGVLGEMAFFEDTPRSADVNSVGVDTIFAIMTFEELRQVHTVSGELQSKLVILLGAMSLQKQRQNLAPQQESKAESGNLLKKRSAAPESLIKRKRAQTKLNAQTISRKRLTAAKMEKTREAAEHKKELADAAKELKRTKKEAARIQKEKDDMSAQAVATAAKTQQELIDLVHYLQKGVIERDEKLMQLRTASLQSQNKFLNMQVCGCVCVCITYNMYVRVARHVFIYTYIYTCVFAEAIHCEQRRFGDIKSQGKQTDEHATGSK
jgi:CRP-like cAMP-binding protein